MFLRVKKSGYVVSNIIQNFKYCFGLKNNLNQTEAIKLEDIGISSREVYQWNGPMAYFIHCEFGTV